MQNLIETLQPQDLGLLSEALEKAALASVVITLVLALLQCFFGYKLLRGWIALIGFLVGFFLGYVVASRLGATGYIPLIVAIIAGILLSIIAFKIYLVGVFIYCGTIAAGATRLIPFPEGEAWLVISFIVAVAVFVLAGFLAVKFAKPCIIGITSISGASSAAQAIQELSPEMVANRSSLLLVFGGLLLAGLVVQILMNRGK